MDAYVTLLANAITLFHDKITHFALPNEKDYTDISWFFTVDRLDKPGDTYLCSFTEWFDEDTNREIQMMTLLETRIKNLNYGEDQIRLFVNRQNVLILGFIGPEQKPIWSYSYAHDYPESYEDVENILRDYVENVYEFMRRYVASFEKE